jgi:hypothetical protein
MYGENRQDKPRGVEWLPKCTSLAVEVHNVEIFGGPFPADNNLLDSVSAVASAVAQWPLKEGYVRIRPAHHRNAEGSNLDSHGARRNSLASSGAVPQRRRTTK